MYKKEMLKIPLSCSVRKNFLDPFDIGGVLLTIWEITCQGKQFRYKQYQGDKNASRVFTQCTSQCTCM